MTTTAEQEIQQQLKGLKTVGYGPGPKQSAINGVIARVTADEAAGRLGSVQFYNLDQAHRDMALIHTRSDAAHALLNTITNMSILLNVRVLLTVNFIGICVLVYLVSRLLRIAGS